MRFSNRFYIILFPLGRLDDQLIVQLFKDRLLSKPCQNQGFILDGFPKTSNQAQQLFQGIFCCCAVLEIIILKRKDKLLYMNKLIHYIKAEEGQEDEAEEVTENEQDIKELKYNKLITPGKPMHAFANLL
jgi:adenylate kinase family enzyme